MNGDTSSRSHGHGVALQLDAVLERAGEDAPLTRDMGLASTVPVSLISQFVHLALVRYLS